MEVRIAIKVKKQIPYSAKWWQGKIWQIGNFKNLAAKTLANCILV